MALLNYTTETAAEKSVAQVSKSLSMVGARRVMHDYDEDGLIVAIAFEIQLNDQTIGFRLPTDWRPVLEVLKQQKAKKVKGHGDIRTTKEQAVRVAWRITQNWVEAQAAYIETMMVTTAQVFLPYAVNDKGQTLYELVASNPGLLLGDGK